MNERWERIVRTAIVCGLCAIVLVFFRDNFVAHLRSPVRGPGVLWAASGMLLLCFRTVLWFRYRAAPPATLADAPAMTVIIPAYNEGAMVLEAIESAAAAEYPHGRLEILVVDDGSTDDTWEHIGRDGPDWSPQSGSPRIAANAPPSRRGSGERRATWWSPSIPTA